MFSSKIIAAGVAALVLTGAAQANGLADGTFAEGAGAGSFTTYDAGSQIGAWNVTNGSIDLIGSYWQAPNGVGYSVDMNGLTAGTISQDFTLAPGEYTLSFWMAVNPDSSLAQRSVQATVGNASQLFKLDFTGQTKTNMDWTLEKLNFTTTGSTTLTFASQTENGPYGAAIGNIAVTAVPEPASMALLLAGLGMVGVMASRRRMGR